MNKKKKFKCVLIIICTILTCLSASAFFGCVEHKHEYFEIDNSATCTQDGVIRYECKCGDWYVENSSAFGHDLVFHASKEPTCVDVGWYEYETCQRDGCGYSNYCELSELGHDLIHYDRIEPTCTETGVDEYDTCQRDNCGYTTYSDDLILPVNGHSWDDGKQTKKPTCTEEGKIIFTCTTCQKATKTEILEKTLHEYDYSEYRYDQTRHYNECACGDKINVDKHHTTNHATATSKAFCQVCGCLMQNETGILFNNLKESFHCINATVSGMTENFSFEEEITIVGNATYLIDDDDDFSSPFNNNTVDLIEGDNKFYILEDIGSTTRTYTVNIYRKHIYEITFDTDGGSSVEKQYVEEGCFATEPITERLGYTFEKWNFDFSLSITCDSEIKAIWKANEDTAYKIEYYLPEINGEYVVETVDKVGVTDSLIYADHGEFAHFSYVDELSTDNGKIAPDGSLVLKMYYTRNQYVVITYNYDTSCGTAIEIDNKFYYGSEINLSATAYLGYDFIGWFNGEELFSEDPNCSFVLSENIFLQSKFMVKGEMSNFHFTSTQQSCEIYGLKDKSITQIVIPNYVTSINNYAFKSSKNLMSVVIGENVASIGDNAFKQCYKIVEVVNKSDLEIKKSSEDYGEIGLNAIQVYNKDDAFENTKLKNDNDFMIYEDDQDKILVGYIGRDTLLTIPNYITKINRYAFFECKDIEQIILSDELNIIEEHAFSNCGVFEIVIPKNVKGVGESAFLGCSSLTSVTIEDGVEYIGESAFSGCSSLTSVTIEDGVEYIGDFMFSRCTSLTEIIIPDSVTTIYGYAFANCDNLKTVEIGNGVTQIGMYAFSKCTSIENLIVGDNVSVFGAAAINSLTGLKSITCPGLVLDYLPLENVNLQTANITLGVIGADALSGCKQLSRITIGKDVTEIESNAFKDCVNLVDLYISDLDAWCNIKFWNAYSNPLSYAKNFYINNSLTTELNFSDNLFEIGKFAFYNFDNLTDINFAKNITSIGYSAFKGCDGLTDLKITNSIANIENYAFADCANFTNIIVPDTVEKIGEGVFKGCDNLVEITLPFIGESRIATSYKSVFGYIFGYSYLPGENTIDQNYSASKKYSYYIPASLKEVTITGGRVVDYAFNNCYNLTSVVLTGNITSIGNNAFMLCDELIELTMPESITTIGNSAFSECVSLAKLSISSNVNSIGNNAFYKCSSLAEIIIPDGVLTIDYNTFGDCSSLKNITFGKDLVSIGVSAFSGCTVLNDINIPENVKHIGNNAFSGCVSLTEIVLPDSLTVINNYLFENCSNLSSVVLGNKVTSINSYAFNGCGKLEDIEIPESVTSVGESAFSKCSNLTVISIPINVTSISKDLFANCVKLQEITIHDKVNYIGSGAFYNTGYYNSPSNWEDDGGLYVGKYLIATPDEQSYAIKDGTLGIASCAFEGCVYLTSIIMPNSINFISDNAFRFSNNMECVYYKGTEDEWNNISVIDTSFNYEQVYYYSEIEPELNKDQTAYNGNYWRFGEDELPVVWDYTLKQEENV